MIDQERSGDDPEMAAEMNLLREAAAPMALPSDVRMRSGVRVAKLAATPATMLSIGAKTWALAALTSVALVGVLAATQLNDSAPATIPFTAPLGLERAAPIQPPIADRQEREASPTTPIVPPEAPTAVHTNRTPKMTETKAVVTDVEQEPPAAASAEPKQDSLVDEIAGLRKAKLLSKSSPSEALAAISDHARRFPKSQLAFERELIAVEALINAGRVGQASSRLRALEPNAKGTLYESRIAGMRTRIGQ